MGSWGHLTTGIAPNTVSQSLGSHQSPPPTLFPPGGLHPAGVRRVLDSFFLSLLPTKPIWPFPYSMLRLSIRYSPEPLLPRIPHSCPTPQCSLISGRLSCWVGGWGGELEHRQKVYSEVILPTQLGLPSREDSEQKICRKVAGKVWGRSGEVEESRLRKLLLGQAFGDTASVPAREGSGTCYQAPTLRAS